MKVWFQEKLCEARDAHVSVFDHGFLYGDGLYETVKAYNYKVYRWDDHYRRMLGSARRLELKCPWSSGTLLTRVVQVLKANQEPSGSVRITITRGPGPLGLDPTVCPRPTLVMLLHPHRDLERYWAHGVSVGIPNVRRNSPDSLDPQIKSNNALNTIFAKMEAQTMGVFEAILMNLNGDLTEGTTSNIFLVNKGQIYTPSLASGILAGITRDVLLEIAPLNGIPSHEGKYTPRDLITADEAFLCSTTLEVVPIIRIKLAGKDRNYWIGTGKPGQVTRHLHQLFRTTLPR